MKPLVSVIVPVYNVRDYVDECLKSLIRQDYENLEIVVVDDGATDGSGEICDELAKGDKRIKVFHKKNGGLSSARNYGIKKAKGKYVCLVDSDDYVKKDFVKVLVGEAIRSDADIVVCGYNDEIPMSQTMTGKEAAVTLLTKQNNMEIIAWNKFYKRELFGDILYPEGENYEDNLTTYKLLSKAWRVAYVQKSLYVYRERVGSITNNDEKEKKLLAREKAAREANAFFKDSDLKKATEIAMLTAKLAWMDFAINGVVEKRHLVESEKWIRNNKTKLLSNKYLTKKLKLYVYLVTNCRGRLYILFRKIRHE